MEEWNIGENGEIIGLVEYPHPARFMMLTTRLSTILHSRMGIVGAVSKAIEKFSQKY